MEIAQDAVFEQLRVEGGDAVYAETPDHGQIRHAHHLWRALLYYRERLLLAEVAGVFFRHAPQPARVDFVYDLQVAGQELFEERHRPLFERLRQEGVVGVGEDLFAHGPRLVPRQPVDVHHKPHELRNRYRRMRVVELDYRLVHKFRPVGMVFKVAADYVLQRARHEEVLLQEPQNLSVFGLVVGVQNL